MKITLDKHIPVAAGMAGGSSNAAAVLFGINRMFSLGLSQKELMERGVTLGADVPYCVMRGTVLAEADRRDPHTTSGMSEMPCADRKTADQCVDKTGL